MLIYFLEAYYEWLEKKKNAISRANEHALLNDTDYALTEFSQYLRNTYIQTIPDTIVSDKGILIKKSKDYYQSRGSIKSIKYLFRLIYGENVAINFDPDRGQDVNGDELGTTFVLGESELTQLNILFLYYNSIHTADFHRLGENFIVDEQSRLLSEEYLVAAENQGIDINSFGGTIIKLVPSSYKYYINAPNLNIEDYRQVVRENTHAAGTQFYESTDTFCRAILAEGTFSSPSIPSEEGVFVGEGNPDFEIDWSDDSVCMVYYDWTNDESLDITINHSNIGNNDSRLFRIINIPVGTTGILTLNSNDISPSPPLIGTVDLEDIVSPNASINVLFKSNEFGNIVTYDIIIQNNNTLT